MLSNYELDSLKLGDVVSFGPLSDEWYILEINPLSSREFEIRHVNTGADMSLSRAELKRNVFIVRKKRDKLPKLTLKQLLPDD